jgi:hypothetical protein
VEVRPSRAAPAIRSELPPCTAATTAELGLLAMTLVSALSFAAFSTLVVQDAAPPPGSRSLTPS